MNRALSRNITDLNRHSVPIRCVSALLIVCFTAGSSFAGIGLKTPPSRVIAANSQQSATDGWWVDQIGLVAQAVETQETSRQYTMADGYTEGRMAADNMGTGGSVLGGFASGLFFSLLGTGIVYFSTGPSSPPMHQVMINKEKGSDYQMGFASGYQERSKQKKRNARLGGGLVGTAIFIWAYSQAQSAE